jgi:peptidoglycan/LPS O-acetylase OafA/YrhL
MFDSDRYFAVGFEYWFMFPLFQFYLIFPVIAWARRRCTSAKTFAVLCTAVSIGWLCLLYFTGLNAQTTWNSAAPVFMWEVGLGIVAAEAFARGHRAYWELAPSWLAAILLLGAGLTGGMALYGGSIGKMLNDAPSLAAIFAAAALVHQTLALWPAAQRTAVHFGQWSYSLYLTHMLALSIAFTIVPNGMLPVFIALPLAVIMAWAFQRLVDSLGHWCSKGTLGAPANP